ncbi:hypothetical protein, partial [Pseudomonas psychrophila]|uniref:hypothetical protein n=1 Tax=Pseudomonas psychrophila TaxID=122355 RepID=UPI001E59350E
GEALSLTELNDRALFNAEFGIGHRGSTVPERSGVALSFRGRPFYLKLYARQKNWMAYENTLSHINTHHTFRL